MKKIISICLVAVIVFSFAGCKGKGNDDSGYSVDISHFVSVGQIREAQFGLGNKVEDLEKEAMKQANETSGVEGHHDHMVLVEGTNYNYFNAPDFYYYYNADNQEKGISCIVGFADIYGFSVGQSGKYEVESALKLEGLNPQSGIADEEEFFFMPFSIENCQKLTCTSKNNVLTFYFEENVLIAAVIYNENWQI